MRYANHNFKNNFISIIKSKDMKISRELVVSEIGKVIQGKTFQVRQLEDHFNTRLFDRTHNKIVLTDAGQKVYFYAEKIFELNSEMEHSLRALSEDTSGTLSIGGSTTIAQYTFPTLLKGFREKYPELSIRICEANTEGIVAKVESSMIDLGIVEAPVSNQD